MRRGFIALCLALACAAAGAATQVSVSIGINVPVYPRLVLVPGYPVYYAPGLPANYFFYDGMYWVLVGDDWYASSWYNGPWYLVSPMVVPYYVLRVPVRYYRAPPPWFRGWAPAAPPRWGHHWGPQWEQEHRGWDRWNRQAVPAPAPLPAYQRRYTGDRYPRTEQQPQLQSRNYRYQPRSDVARQHYREQRSDHPAPTRPPQAAVPTHPPQAVPTRPPQAVPTRPPQAAVPPRPAPHDGRPPGQQRHEGSQPAGQPPVAGRQAHPSPAGEPPQDRGRGHEGKDKRNDGGGRGPGG